MVDLNSYLPLRGDYLWVIVGLLLIVGEIFSGGFVLLWFAVGALVAGLCAFLGASFNVQLSMFSISSLLLFTASRTIFRRVLMRGRPSVSTNVDAMIGRQAEVMEEIGPGMRAGTVKVGGETWGAISDGTVYRPGTVVTIEAIQGLKLRVRAIDQAESLADARRKT